MKLTAAPYPMVLKRKLRPLVRGVRHLGLRAADVLLVSYPRSGSTWLRFMLTELLVTGASAEWETVNRSIPYAGSDRSAPVILPSGGRLVKTHDLTSGRARRAIYLARDGRQVALAEYRWWVRGGYARDFDAFLADSLAGKRSLFGRWDDHVHYWLDSDTARRGDLLVVRYEDLRASTMRSMRSIVDFLGVEVPDDLVTRTVTENDLVRTRQKEERAAPSDVRRHGGTERFVGRGAVEGWRTELTPTQREAIEASYRPALERLGYVIRDEDLSATGREER